MSQPPSAYRAPRPAAGAAIAWPDAFGTRYTIFVDTEEEFDWTAPLRRDGHGTRAMAALPDAHRRFADMGAALTYLIDYPVATCAMSVDLLRQVAGDGRTAIGTQLHPWVNPPFDEDVTSFNSFAGNLPEALEEAKLRRLTEVIAAAFGTPPVCYRAGRYGIGRHSMGLLAKLGYRLDTSMRSAYDYTSEGGPDFTAIGNHAFRTGPDDQLVELPLTTMFIGHARRLGQPLYHRLGGVPRGRGIASRLGLLSRVALTPEDMPVAEALEAVRIAIGEGVRVLNLSFHSPSLAPGYTPYVRDAADLAAFYRWWDQVLGLLAARGVQSASLDEVLEAANPRV